LLLEDAQKSVCEFWPHQLQYEWFEKLDRSVTYTRLESEW
jgi:hypothetical protein